MKRDLAWPEFHIEAEVVSGKVAVPGLKWPISYRLDNRFTDDDGMLAIAEYKTAWGFGMKDIKEKGPKDSALAQTLTYMKMSGIGRAYLMYVSRDNADRVLFILEMVEAGWIMSRMFPSGELNEMKRFPMAIWDRMLARLAEIESHVEADTLPDRPYRIAIKNNEIREKFTKDKVDYKSDWQCMYCPFLTKCWGEIAANYPETDNSEEFKNKKLIDVYAEEESL
jgi:hypothetical protein